MRSLAPVPPGRRALPGIFPVIWAEFSSVIHRFRPGLHNFSTALSLPYIPIEGALLDNGTKSDDGPGA